MNQAELTKTAVDSVIRNLINIVIKEIKAGEVVNLTGFGRFSSRKRHARLGVDPLNIKKKIKMPEVLVPKFKAGKRLKDTLKAK